MYNFKRLTFAHNGQKVLFIADSRYQAVYNMQGCGIEKK